MLARLLMLLLAVVGLAVLWTFSFLSKRFEDVASGAIPLEARDFPRPTVVTVGTGATFENHQRLGPAVVVAKGERMLLVDAGRAVAQALRAVSIPVRQPEALLLTSLLPENTLGLDDLLVGRALDPEAPPLRVIGPAGTHALVEGLLAAHAPGLAPGTEAGLAVPPAVEASDVADAVPLEVAGFTAAPLPLPGGPLPALAWRLEADGRTALISSVLFDGEALVEQVRGTAVWVHETYYGAALEAAIEHDALRPDALRRWAAWNTRIEDVGELASHMGARTLVLTRLRPPPVFDSQYEDLVEPTFRGRVLIAHDGLEVTL